MIKKIFSKLELEEGASIPRGYGFAYWEYTSTKAFFYIIPINLLVNWYRKIQQRIIIPSLSTTEKTIYKAYMKGRSDGIRIYQEFMERELNKFLEERKKVTY